MTYEVVYVDGVEDDFIELNLTENRVIAINEKIKTIAKSNKPSLLTERVLNTPLRKIPFANLRIFIYINDVTNVIYCLSVKHHNKCYKQKELNKVLTILRKIEQE